MTHSNHSIDLICKKVGIEDVGELGLMLDTQIQTLFDVAASAHDEINRLNKLLDDGAGILNQYVVELTALREENERLRAGAQLGPIIGAEAILELEAENARLLQDRLDYSNVKTTDGMNSSEWILRTGKAERERDALEARVKELVAESDRQTEEIASLTRILEGKR
jgi:hypothetical protein